MMAGDGGGKVRAGKWMEGRRRDRGKRKRGGCMTGEKGEEIEEAGQEEGGNWMAGCEILEDRRMDGGDRKRGEDMRGEKGGISPGILL
jgi:hypothetical protein